jgi:hypothetical protein
MSEEYPLTVEVDWPGYELNGRKLPAQEGKIELPDGALIKGWFVKTDGPDVFIPRACGSVVQAQPDQLDVELESLRKENAELKARLRKIEGQRAILQSQIGNDLEGSL